MTKTKSKSKSKCKTETVKLEFTSTPPNNVKNFDVNTVKYGDKIDCTAKAAGKKGINYFSSKFKFTIDASCKNPRITNIHIADVTHIGKTNDPLKVCSKYHYYYNINCSDSSSCSSDEVIDDEFEQSIYNAIKSMLMTGKVTKFNKYAKVTFTLPTLYIDSMCMNIKVGTDKFAGSSEDNPCSLSAISKNCDKSYCSSTCYKSSSSSNKHNLKKYIKIIAWAVVIIFVIFILRKGMALTAFIPKISPEDLAKLHEKFGENSDEDDDDDDDDEDN